MSKYCAKCNQLANDQDAFCSNCGSAEFYVAEETTQEVYEQPTNQEVAYEQPVYEQPVYEQISYEQPVYEQPVKKGFFKKIGVKLVCIILPILIAAGLVWMNLEPISGFFLKSFGSEEKYFEHTTGVAAKDRIDDITETYDKIFFNQKEQAVNSTLSFNVSKDLTKLISAFIPASANDVINEGIDVINGTKLNFYANTDGDRTETQIGVLLDNEEFASAYVMGDAKDGKVYIKLNGLSDKVLGIDMDELYELMGTPAAYESIMQLKDDILPDAKTVNKLLNRYFDAAIGGIKDIDKDSEKIEIDGVEQKLTVLTVPFSEEQALNVVLPVLEEAAEDKDLEKIIENAQDALIENDIIDEDDLEDDAYDMFLDAVDEAIDYLSDYEADDEEIFEVKLYIKGISDICGIAVEVDGDTMFSWINVEKGNEIATEISAPILSEAIFNDDSKFVGIKGKGTNKGGIVNAEYDVIVDEDAYGKIIVTNYDEKQAEKGYLNGKFRVEATKTLYDLIEDETGLDDGIINSFDPYIEVSFENSDKVSNIKIAVGSKDKEYVRISLNSEFSKAQKIDDMKADYGIDEAEEWVSQIDVEKLTQKLEKTNAYKFVTKIMGLVYEKDTAVDEYVYDYDDYDYDDYDYDYDYDYDEYDSVVEDYDYVF